MNEDMDRFRVILGMLDDVINDVVSSHKHYRPFGISDIVLRRMARTEIYRAFGITGIA